MAEENKKHGWFRSLFSDKEWDFDLSKVWGTITVIIGFVGFFMEKPHFEWLVAGGLSLIATGKFSKEG